MNTASRKKISIALTNQTSIADIDQEALKKLAQTVCRQYRATAVQVHIVLVAGKTIRRLGRQFLGSDKTTDVISFDLTDPYEPHRSFEIVVNADLAQRQGRKHGHSTQAELALYLTHGLLHQFGLDDADPRQAQNMHKTEDRILQKAGYGQVYYQQ